MYKPTYLSEKVLTRKHADAEWRTMIIKSAQDVPNTFPVHKCPNLGSRDFAKCIDHALLKPEATMEEIDSLCAEARKYEFQSVCVRLAWTQRAVQNLRGSGIAVACVIGFHEGTYTVAEKVKEASLAVSAGATELDMVVNYFHLNQQRYSDIYTDIAAVRQVAPHPVILKVIIETAQLKRIDVVAACVIAKEANADFVKTSTGFNGQGATEETVRMMKSIAGPEMKVKASGGIKTVTDCLMMMESGADRIGTSNGVSIMTEAQTLLEDLTHQAAEKGRKNSRPSEPQNRLYNGS